MGTERDVELASAMYKLVIDAIEFYTHKYVKEHSVGIRSHTQSLKDDYTTAFMDGLERKFEEQIKVQEWGLVLVVPKEVEEEYERTVSGYLSYNIPSLESQETYKQGYEDGNKIDYKKETIS